MTFANNHHKVPVSERKDTYARAFIQVGNLWTKDARAARFTMARRFAKIAAELMEVDGRKLRFKIEAHDEDKKVGEGTHRRAIIAIQRKS